MNLEALYFGGSFNPPHSAHTTCAAAAAKALGLAPVILMPTGQSAMKNAADLAPAADRLAMTRLAAEASTSVPMHVDDLEIARPGISFTIDTIEHIRVRGNRPVHWLIGADQLYNFHRWHRFADLLQIAQFHVMARPGYAIDWSAIDQAVYGLKEFVVTVPQIDVSATEVRQRIAKGEPTDGLIAPKVRQYIDEHRLYRI